MKETSKRIARGVWLNKRDIKRAKQILKKENFKSLSALIRAALRQYLIYN